jgi:regulator of sigma E protease
LLWNEIVGYTVLTSEVLVGLGFVIFVHELGHFLVAKLCGVKCEKFYLGFDIGGLKLCRFRYGETEYGVGILPLGGYVKMLGQEDNPARIREEMERAKREEEKAASEGRQPPVSANVADEGPESDVTASSSPLFDPRSFLAKSVPKRMAIISAGVIMNVIFAFLMAMVAYCIGVPETPCVVGNLMPGEGAWQAGLRSGDQILEIAGKKMEKFRDLQTAISLGHVDPQKGISLLVRRPGVKEPFLVNVKPDRSLGAFIIGVTGPMKTSLLLNRPTWLIPIMYPVVYGSAANHAKPQFECGDRIVQIKEIDEKGNEKQIAKPIDSYGQIESDLARTADRPITVVVERDVLDAGKPTSQVQRVATKVEPQRMRELGLAMRMGPVTAVQRGSPAAIAGIQPGDWIVDPGGDPMRLPDRLARRAGQQVDVTLFRDWMGLPLPLVVPVRLREPTEILIEGPNGPLGIPALGCACRVLNQVASVVPGGPAARAGIQAGDLLTKATLVPPDKAVLEYLQLRQPEVSADLGPDEHNWPAVMAGLQDKLPGTRVTLSYLRPPRKAAKAHNPKKPLLFDMSAQPINTEAIEPIEARDWFSPDRGFLFEPLTFERKADSIGSALKMGGRETFDAVTIVFRTVGALSTRRVSIRLVSGPLGILSMALAQADQGPVKLLLFLTLLSANLAVLNFLPIPVLDGGHFVLLAYEGIRGKPADERVQVALSYIGLILILTLMVWAFGLDLGIFSRR